MTAGAAGRGDDAPGVVGVGVDAPGVVGVGIDLIELDRIRRAIDRTPALLERLWTPGEREHCAAPSGRVRVGGLAARFAAKEAVAKALGSGFDGFGFRDVEVVVNAEGAPGIVLHGGAAERATELGVGRVLLSLSRTRDLALAQAVAVRG